MNVIVFSALLVGWMAYYLCQRTLPSAMTAMIRINSTLEDDSTASAGITRAYIGQLQSMFAVANSISFLISGILSDVLNVKLMFFTGLALSGTLLALFPLTESSHALGVLVYICFGLCQGCGWPAATGVLRQTYSPSELGLIYGVVDTGSSIAIILTPFLVLPISSASGWKSSFFIVGAAVLCLSFLVLSSMGIASGSESRTSTVPQQAVSDHSRSISQWFYGILDSRILWAVVFMRSILWLLKASIMDWGQLYLIQSQGLTKDHAGKAVGILQLGGMLGKVACGHLSNVAMKMQGIGSVKTSGKTCQALLLLINLLCLSVILVVFSTATSSLNYVWLIALEIFLVGLLLEGSLIVITLVVLDAARKSQSGTALAVTTSSSQLFGRFLAGWPFNGLVEQTGWSHAFLVVSLLCFVATAVSGYLARTLHSIFKAEKASSNEVQLQLSVNLNE